MTGTDGEGIPALEALRAQVEPRWAEAWWNLGHDHGWQDLVVRLGDDLAEIAPGYTVAQVKEKFGSLDFSTRPGTDDEAVREQFAALIHSAEAEASRTCQRCRQPGVLSRARHYDVAVLCDEHREQSTAETGERWLAWRPYGVDEEGSR